MNYTTTTNFQNKTTQEHLEDIYCRINRLENYMLGIKQEKEKENKKNERGKIVIDIDFNFEPARKRLQEFAESIPKKDD